MKKILVVDDEKKMRKVYINLLTGEGFKVIEASNAVDANEIVKKENVDLVLLDIKMPEADGTILYEVIQSFYKNRVKVIIASVYSLDEQKRLVTGAVDYYDKSQGTDMLLVKIRRILKDELIEENTYYR